MTETIEEEALRRVNTVARERGATRPSVLLDRAFVENEVIYQLITEHRATKAELEAFRQEVSDALSVYQKAASTQQRSLIWDALTRFIIPQPDPIAEAWIEATGNTVGMEPLIAALAARGLKIVEDK